MYEYMVYDSRGRQERVSLGAGREGDHFCTSDVDDRGGFGGGVFGDLTRGRLMFL